MADLDAASLWWDELSTWYEAMSGFRSAHSAPANPVMASWLYRLTGSTSDVVVRWGPAVCGTFAIGIAFCIGRRLSSDRSGLLAAALLACSPLAVTYSREGRPYGLFQLAAALLLLAWLSARRTQSVARWALYSAALALCCMTHLVTLQVVAAFGVAGVAELLVAVRRKTAREQLRRTAFLAGATAAGLTIGLVWLLGRERVLTVLEGSSPGTFFAHVRTYFLCLGPKITHQPALAIQLVALGMLVLFVVGSTHLMQHGQRDTAVALGAMVVVSLVVMYLTLGHKGGWEWERYISHLTVPYCGLIAVGAERLATRARPRGLATVLLATLVLVMAPGIDAMLRLREVVEQRPDWRGGLRAMAATNRTDHYDGVVFYCRDDGMARYGDESERLLAAYAIYGDHSPLYLARGRHVRRVAITESTRGKVELPTPVAARVDLPVGRYLVITRFGGSCGMHDSRAPQFKCSRLHANAIDLPPPKTLSRRGVYEVFACHRKSPR